MIVLQISNHPVGALTRCAPTKRIRISIARIYKNGITRFLKNNDCLEFPNCPGRGATRERPTKMPLLFIADYKYHFFKFLQETIVALLYGELEKIKTWYHLESALQKSEKSPQTRTSCNPLFVLPLASTRFQNLF
jgi:hypothetical protein